MSRIWFEGLTTLAAGEGVDVAIWGAVTEEGAAGVVIDAFTARGMARPIYDVEVAPL